MIEPSRAAAAARASVRSVKFDFYSRPDWNWKVETDQKKSSSDVVLLMIVDNNDTDLEVSDTCVRNSLLS